MTIPGGNAPFAEIRQIVSIPQPLHIRPLNFCPISVRDVIRPTGDNV